MNGTDTAECPFTCTLSYVTREYSIRLGYADLTRIMDLVYRVWEHMERAGVTDEKSAGMFGDLVEHIGFLREWTGDASPFTLPLAPWNPG
jgi:hypothetical protein